MKLGEWNKPFAGLILALALGLSFFIPDIKNVFATSHELLIKGYAWSSNIGWISFSCDNDDCDTSNYEVKVNSFDGITTGYAWSSNIGWIRTNPDGPYPEAPNSGLVLRAVTTPDGSRKQFQGWARACSVFETPSSCSGDLDINRGAWDGWIKMSGNTTICPDPPSSGAYETCLTPDGQNITGYAWGGEVIGWIHFDSDYGPGRQVVTPTPPIKTCEISPTRPSCPDE